MLRYGILGFGGHASKRLMPGFERSHRSRAVGFWRQNQTLALEVAGKYNLKSFASPDALCTSPEIDAVFVASPDALHLEHVSLAVDHKKPVLCEKPLAMNAQECSRMLEAAQQAGVRFGVAHVFRFETSVRRLRELVSSGSFGVPLVARAEFHYLGRQSPRRWISDPALACGGPIADIGVHCIDALRFIFNDEVTAVTAAATYDKGAAAIESAGNLLLEFARGTLASVIVSARGEYQTPLSIVCAAGHLAANHAFTVDFPLELRSKRPGSEPAVETITNYEAYAAQVDAFSDWVERGTPFPAPAIDGLRNQLVLDAAYRSIRSGEKVLLDSL